MSQSIKKNVFYSFLKAFMTLVFPLISFPYASRILQPEGIGKVNFANSIVSYFTLISMLGISAYSTRECAKRQNNKEELSRFVKEILLINSISTIISSSIFLLVVFNVPKLYEYRTLLLISGTNILFTTLGIDWFYSGIEEFKYITIRSFLFQVLGIIYMFIFVKTKEDINHYAVFGIITTVGSNICNIIHSRHFINFRVKNSISIRKHLKPIFTFFGMSFVGSIYTVLDSSMLGFLSNNEQIGFYTAATKINKMIVGLLTAILNVLLPRLTFLNNNNEEEQFVALIKKSECYLFLISVPMIFGLIALAKPIILIISGANYIPAVISMIVMSPIILFISMGSLIGVQILPSINKEKITLYSYILGATINVVFNSIFIPRYGALGAGIGTVFAELSVCSFQFIYMRKMLFNKESISNFLEALICSVIMFIAVYFFIKISQNVFIQLAGGITIGVFVYGTLLLILRNKYFLEILHYVKLKLAGKK